MPPQEFSVQATADQTVVTNAETVIATLTGVSTDRAGRTVRLNGEFQITTGGSTTALTPRIRRDGIAGAVVAEGNAIQLSAAAGSTEEHTIQADDPRASEIFNATYVLTVQSAAAAANHSVLLATLRARTD